MQTRVDYKECGLELYQYKVKYGKNSATVLSIPLVRDRTCICMCFAVPCA